MMDSKDATMTQDEKFTDFRFYKAEWIRRWGTPVIVVSQYQRKGKVHAEYFAGVLGSDMVNAKRLSCQDFVAEQEGEEFVLQQAYQCAREYLDRRLQDEYRDGERWSELPPPPEYRCIEPEDLFPHIVRGDCNSLFEKLEDTQCSPLGERMEELDDIPRLDVEDL